VLRQLKLSSYMSVGVAWHLRRSSEGLRSCLRTQIWETLPFLRKVSDVAITAPPQPVASEICQKVWFVQLNATTHQRSCSHLKKTNLDFSVGSDGVGIFVYFACAIPGLEVKYC
jgi:hypothetical protein